MCEQYNWLVVDLGFSPGGAAIFLAVKRMKMKKFGPQGVHTWDPFPRSANAANHGTHLKNSCDKRNSVFVAK